MTGLPVVSDPSAIGRLADALDEAGIPWSEEPLPDDFSGEWA